MAVQKYSRQRESICKYLAGTKSHPTADMVYNAVREEYPNISLGTVYRNLNLLVEQGMAQKISCGNGIDRFDYDTSNHYHFICKKCNCVLDLEMESIAHINTIAGAKFAGEIEGSITYFHGTCPECREAVC